MIATRHFEQLARELGELKGFAPRVAVIEHPLGGVTQDEVDSRARQVIESIIAFTQ
ncbi:MAG: hypothetical protein JRH16_02630 [Deltaproteobacteria bacterium]|nr:hypothetical protein [Deltaproteobacteria bacterium]MBW2362444.1 hypothetical protein [Deltaproteobacteria bacterium]